MNPEENKPADPAAEKPAEGAPAEKPADPEAKKDETGAEEVKPAEGASDK